MNTVSIDEVSIKMPKGALLILFGYLSRSYDCWRKSEGNSDETTFALQQPDAGERKALWLLEGEIERTLPEVFSADYAQLVARSKQLLISDRSQI